MLQALELLRKTRGNVTLVINKCGEEAPDNNNQPTIKTVHVPTKPVDKPQEHQPPPAKHDKTTQHIKKPAGKAMVPCQRYPSITHLVWLQLSDFLSHRVYA